MSDLQTVKRRGRPPKPGPRKRINHWLPEQLVELLNREAADRGIPATDQLAEILAARYAGEVMPRSA